jgi:VWFA-related protein
MSSSPPAVPHRVSEPEAHVLITIARKSGAPASTLEKTDILVRDDKLSVAVSELRSVKDEPLMFSLLVDASGSTQAATAAQIKGAIALFRALSNGKTGGYLVLFRDEVFTNNQILNAQTAEQILSKEDSRRGSTALFDAVVHAATKQLAAVKYSPSTRRAIFNFSDGEDNVSHSSLEQTLIVLQREGIPLFSVITPSSKPDKRSMAILQSLSEKTGGGIFVLDDAGEFVSRLLNRIDNQYVASFPASPARPHKLHSLEVKSVAKDFELSAPTQYLAP